MQMLRKKAIILGSSSFIGLGACCYLVYNHSLMLLLILLLLTSAATVCFYRQLQRLSTASLIMENSILTIPVVTVWSNNDRSLPKRKKSALVVVSCFGVLSGNEVYKFNCDGIRLLAVEINRESMFLTFGTEEKKRHIKLLHGLSNKEDIRVIAEKFRYETGVIPVVAGWQEDFK